MRGTSLRGHKLNAKPVRIAGRSFGSGDEAARGAELTLLETCGAIRDLRFQVVILLAEAVKYRADFAYIEAATGRVITEEFKGYEGGASGARWRIVQQLWRKHGTSVLRITKRDPRSKRFFVAREILAARGKTTVSGETA